MAKKGTLFLSLSLHACLVCAIAMSAGGVLCVQLLAAHHSTLGAMA